jgi:hypothetical protein
LPVFDSRIDSEAWFQWVSMLPVKSEWYLLEFNPTSANIDISQYLGKGDSVYRNFPPARKQYSSSSWQQFYQILEHTDHLKAHTDHLSDSCLIPRDAWFTI